uniref:Uncharacterized protein n=1 Tax=Spongospora subterranea TaxID=70186 RepID=A0A0H5QNY9_9EUKA|eukprot:CRZ03307.1 hypothetical protein [Spongospora subterranea]
MESSKRFSLLVGCVALGASSRMASRIVQIVHGEKPPSNFTEDVVSWLPRIIHDLFLQSVFRSSPRLSILPLAFRLPSIPQPCMACRIWTYALALPSEVAFTTFTCWP